MLFFKPPFRFIYKGKYFPGFIAKVDADTTIKLDRDKELTSIGNELIPSITESIQTAIEDFTDKR